jgi:polyhydroxybutyrate depolymerase
MRREYVAAAMHPLRILVAAGLCMVSTASSAPIPCNLMVGGVQRRYLLVIPPGYDGKAAVPVVFVFHGKGSDGALEERVLGFTQLARTKNFISVYPDGLELEWNGGRMRPISSESAKSDDVKFVSAMIDELEAHYKVDPKRIFAAGTSNGAIFCHTLAARLSERIAAIGPVSGSVGEAIPKHFRPMSPVSVISFNGIDDHLVPYAGHPYYGEGVLSVPDSVAFWVGVDGCDSTPTQTVDKPSPLDDGLRIIRLFYGRGKNGSEVSAFIISHGGHTWPGVPTDPTWARTAGKTAMSISATGLMWDFFEKHPKP